MTPISVQLADSQVYLAPRSHTMHSDESAFHAYHACHCSESRACMPCVPFPSRIVRKIALNQAFSTYLEFHSDESPPAWIAFHSDEHAWHTFYATYTHKFCHNVVRSQTRCRNISSSLPTGQFFCSSSLFRVANYIYSVSLRNYVNLSHQLNTVILLTVYVLFKTIKYSEMMTYSYSICLLGGLVYEC